jgi:transcriptional regulator with XRE-family HTH domain
MRYLLYCVKFLIKGKKMTIGEKLRAFANENFKNLNKFATAVDMKPPGLQLYLNDKRRPGGALIEKLVKVGISADWLFLSDDDSNQYVDYDPEFKSLVRKSSGNQYSNSVFGRIHYLNNKVLQVYAMIKHNLREMRIDVDSRTLFIESANEMYKKAFDDNINLDTKEIIPNDYEIIFVKVIRIAGYIDFLSTKIDDDIEHLKVNYFEALSSIHSTFKKDPYSHGNVDKRLSVIPYIHFTEILTILVDIDDLLTRISLFLDKLIQDLAIDFYKNYNQRKIDLKLLDIVAPKLLSFAKYINVFDVFKKLRDYERDRKKYVLDCNELEQNCLEFFYKSGRDESERFGTIDGFLSKEEIIKLKKILEERI